MTKKNDKRENYHQKMLGLGFVKIHPYVHQDDKDKALKTISDLREKRLKTLAKGR